MTAITGYQSNAVMVLGTTGGTYGTAVAASTGDKIIGTVNDGTTAQELQRSAIGSGAPMRTETRKGRVTPVATLAGDLGFRNGYDKALAQFFGTASSPAEQTVGQADYMHRLTMNASANPFFNTFAYKLASGDTVEFPSAAIRSVTTSFSEVQSYLQCSLEILGNKYEIASAVNTQSVVDAATLQETELVVVTEDQDFWLDTEASGALASGDQFNIISYSRTLTRPQDFIGNVRGAAGNDRPVISDLIVGTLTVELQWLADKTYFTAWDAGTLFKSKMNFEGTQIGSGVNKAFIEYNPRMVLVQKPSYNITEAGFNPVTLEFVLLKADSNPTGMNSTYPYTEIINGRSTTYVS